MPTDYDHRSAAEQVAKSAAQHAVDVDEGARFPGATVKAAREAGLLGLLSAEEVARRALAIAAEICVYTNGNVTLETIDAAS